jgi:hypothetical protein
MKQARISTATETLDWQEPLRVDLSQNPFAFFTPEALHPELIHDLFVHEIPEYGLIRQPGHAFLNGPRGSGKSMIFRFLEPDCQRLATKKKIEKLRFFGAYIPIKRTHLQLTEFDRLHKEYADAILNEHVLVLFFLINFFRRAIFTKAFVGLNTARNRKQVDGFYNDTFDRLLHWSGWESENSFSSEGKSLEQLMNQMMRTLERIYSSTMLYMRRLSITKSPLDYSGPLLTFDDFLMPFISSFKSMTFMPDGPVYFLVDDADQLSTIQAKIINTWVWKRVLKEVSLKLSTQFQYKSFMTVSDERIETPHDFQSVNISDVYTSEYADHYRSRVRQIVERRLKAAGIKRTAYQFFPPDKGQQEKMDKIRSSLTARWATSGRGFRARDDANRYAVSEYMKQIGGRSKGKSKYSYSGFDQLVNISSGVVRYFLDPAAKMFERELLRNRGLAREHSSPGSSPADMPFPNLGEISSHVQNDLIRKMSDNWYIEELVRRTHDKGKRDTAVIAKRYLKLKNLIDSIGSLFHILLLSDRAERRVFSLAIDGVLEGDAQAVLDLGVAEGFLHRSTIGRKDNFGRSDLYVLTRRFAPYFNLDPNGFAGYFYIRPEYVSLALDNPRKFMGWLRAHRLEINESAQMSLFGQ